MTAIATEGLRKEFGPKIAVENLTLTVNEGEVFGFLGPNGAGKTTSVKMLLGLVKPTSGHATLLGAPIGDRKTRAKVGFLPEHFRFQDWLTGREFLAFHGKLFGLRSRVLADRIEELLARVDLLDAADRRLHDYSKGMQQRIGLAQALLNRPDLVFLDEPTSGLDPIGRLLVRDCISELRDHGTAVFLNSHLLSEVEITCDRVAFVKRGVVLREMSLTSSEFDLDVELRVGSSTPELLVSLGAFGSDVVEHEGVVRMRAKTESSLPEIARAVVESGADLYKLTSGRKSLESLFLEIIGEDERAG